MRLGVTLGIGVDVVHTPRFQRILARNDDYVARFMARILHPSERPRFVESPPAQQINQLSGAWAAKEALFKTLDPVDQKRFQFNQWYRHYNPQGKPFIRNDHYQHKDEEFLLSVSHDGEVLVANVLRQKNVDTSSL
ncbi:4'-phosphopantetheinyl transferase [Suhomyces tanzawaensis NRRL Y-17324]|uniref:4'-phosphopantetheinyl transferase n=1 Tax=Suhomyces tanzawaensis NRRL Y-17324 TaxID=984487 RepID=A0A1E4SD91_9ASCO|nr:4'-phosphopantetheinyl transferase [Suhomyces tanzawaensis NRRL Y-17324]ODV77436.1 4'-phosphopantetheinyl transferase [Suhomyces tanzawaensis NRRL Y-17324]